MKMHPGMDRLRAFAADEPTSARVRAHLAACAECRSTVAFVREVRGQLNEAPPLAAPAGTWERIAQRVQQGDIVLLPTHERQPAQRRLRHPMAAAIALLVLAGGAAAIVPDIVPGEWFGRQAAEPVPEFAPATAAAAPTELLMPASSSTLSVVLERPRPGLRVRMRREERTSLRIQATGAAAGAVFRSADDMITITDAGAGELLLVIPRDASVRVTADGVLWAGTEGGDLLVHAPVVDTIGADVLILVPGQ